MFVISSQLHFVLWPLMDIFSLLLYFCNDVKIIGILCVYVVVLFSLHWNRADSICISTWFVCRNAAEFFFWYINVNILYTSYFIIVSCSAKIGSEKTMHIRSILFVNIMLCVFRFDFMFRFDCMITFGIHITPTIFLIFTCDIFNLVIVTL